MTQAPAVPRTLLIVDDHPGFRDCARSLLEADGFRVIGQASTGEAGIREAESLRPDLVLVDVVLPDMDGFEVARRLARRGGPEVVLTSSRARGDFASLIAASTARGFVSKHDLSGAALMDLTA
jgi:DNA-binding NarL/FixJ family response regulator